MTTIYHNPRCSKSRAALQLLQQHFDDVTVIHYLDTPPPAATIRQLLTQLDIPAAALLRRGEAPYKTLALKDQLDNEEALIEAMAAHPILIERPIVLIGDEAVIGRPTSRVQELIES